MSDKNFKYIVLGAGVAGAAAVAGIRERDAESSVLLIGGEAVLPYDRPPLSKQLWFGKKTLEQIFVHDRAWYANRGVALALGVRIAALDAGDKTLSDEEGNTYRFEKLLLATGGWPRRLTIPGGDLPGISYYRDLEDYRRLRAAAGEGKTAIVVGGGFIGSEMAAALTINRIATTVVFPEATLAARVLPDFLGRRIQRHYEERGATILAGDLPSSIETENGRFAMITRNGKRIVADLLLVGAGIAPETGLADAAGLRVGNGVIVNEYLQTTSPDIYAAGDNAFFPYHALGKSMRVEHWDNAINQGKAAGRNMAGAHEPYRYLPYFFSDLFDFGYEAVGDIDPTLQTVASWKKENDTGIVYFLKDGRVRGVLLCNVWDQVPAARELIVRGETWNPAELSYAIAGGGDGANLADEHCVRLPADAGPLPGAEACALAAGAPNWRVTERSMEREFRLPTFRRAIEFLNEMATLADLEDHHPDICNSYDKVRVTLSTHQVGGLSRNDFILAAKIDRLIAAK
jgi:NAD(P)H-nitrite reductase large subunit/pterin-4a-carbinolamine dehydratase